MKKKISKEVQFCDKCDKEDSYPTPCLLCGTEMCYECKQKHGTSYNHAVYFQGSGDGFYCHSCDEKLRSTGTNKLHSAYLKIKNLRQELELWSADFKGRQAVAENELKLASK